MEQAESTERPDAEEHFKRRLLELGLLTRIAPPPDVVPRDRQPVAVVGNPVSETVMKERR